MLLSSWIVFHLNRWTRANVSEKLTASILTSSTLKKDSASFVEIVAAIYDTTQRHFHEDITFVITLIEYCILQGTVCS
jgi:hypothetical protein